LVDTRLAATYLLRELLPLLIFDNRITRVGILVAQVVAEFKI